MCQDVNNKSCYVKASAVSIMQWGHRILSPEQVATEEKSSSLNNLKAQMYSFYIY